MALITLKIDKIVGTSDVEGYKKEIECTGFRDSIFMPPAVSAGRTRAARTAGVPRHADVLLTRNRDIASPKLAEECSAGTKLGTTRISIFRSAGSPKAYMVYTLYETVISRIETETDDSNGTVYMPHVGSPGNMNFSPASGPGGLALAAAAGTLGGVRLSPMPYTALPKGAVGNREVERIWLNATEIKWTYTPYKDGVAGGAVERGWGIRRGKELEI